jgi:hypothetical protein
MLTIITLLSLFIILDIAALHWGFDSTDNAASCEWERRWHWHDSGDDRTEMC